MGRREEAAGRSVGPAHTMPPSGRNNDQSQCFVDPRSYTAWTTTSTRPSFERKPPSNRGLSHRGPRGGDVTTRRPSSTGRPTSTAPKILARSHDRNGHWFESPWLRISIPRSGPDGEFGRVATHHAQEL